MAAEASAAPDERSKIQIGVALAPDIASFIRATTPRSATLNREARSLLTGGFSMDSATASHFEIGHKVDQTWGNHVEGIVVAMFTNKASEQRYAVEISGLLILAVESHFQKYFRSRLTQITSIPPPSRAL
jgi:hypothetical protein